MPALTPSTCRLILENFDMLCVHLVCRVALFTRGLPLRIVMIGTLTGLQWGIYDAFKVYVGL